ncbi:DUF1890 domain-containing protein [Methanothermobacter wolfeii]|uniref:DUF1890 domain-containing protein n=1 Tax=Methanothermobacter wolfeii TaxID=145261 RepID=A0A9E7RRR6_METWO|nr:MULTISPECIES: DUF1890 domain-containing protein [Methanothermobacter]MDI6842137.1 DUF1890 domain-containing protein [Methanothermobacter wolfeii]NLM02529.1 DUF1890 domain-containing protein [Methanothermobacter wolfeii]QHN06549.1 DUF1890 domain-containing protein [Methanothermobacter sp. THM-1]UXH31083.1 DUF1890 domain-containing protein [Methanothermobacter wolfeii]SCM57590.1 putative protein MJ0452 [Methanothermobacter wolfeii]
MKKTLILLGCPESPVQIPLALYTSHRLREKGFSVTLTANPAAIRLIQVADPEGIYTGELKDLESCLEGLSEGDYEFLVGFVPNDAAAAYLITFAGILNTRTLAVVFERDAGVLEELVDEIMDGSDAEVIAARAHHNPAPLRVRIDRFMEEL